MLSNAPVNNVSALKKLGHIGDLRREGVYRSPKTNKKVKQGSKTYRFNYIIKTMSTTFFSYLEFY